MTDATGNHDGHDDPLARVLASSRVVTALRAPFHEDSRAMRATQWLGSTVRNAFLYRWLTKEPEPEVVIIDLRETWTVGPVIRVLDWVVEHMAPYWRESALKRGFDRVIALGERAADTKFGGLVMDLLEPPKPATERNEPDDAADHTTDDE